MIDAEIKRLLQNIISIGTICEVKEGYALAKVKICEMVSDFFPVVSFANSFKRHFTPIRVGEQVLVISTFGEASSGVIVRGIFNKGCKEPFASNTQEVIEYEDGTTITYDTKSKELRIKSSGKVVIECLSVIINGNTTINGELKVSSTIADMKGDLTSHTHGGITTPR